MYYTFNYACDTAETGPVFPQIQKMTPGYDYESDNSVYALENSRHSFPEFVPNLDSFILHGRAKLTDVISTAPISGCGFLISGKLKEIFERYRIVSHQFYPAKVISRGKIHDNYFWMHIISDMTDLVDYPRSTFFVYKHYLTNDGVIKVNSIEDYFEKRKQLQKENPGINITIWSEKLQLKPQFDKKLDLFTIDLFDTDFYISQSLKDDLTQNNITGFVSQIANKIIV